MKCFEWLRWYDYASIAIIYVCGIWKIIEIGSKGEKWGKKLADWIERKLK